MITELRKSFSDKWVKLILLVPILAMGLSSLLYNLPYFFKGSTGVDRVALTVNDTDIDIQQMQRQLAKEMGRINMIRQQLGPNADMFIKMYGLDDPQALATQSLITESLVSNIADTMKLTIDPKLIMQRLQDPSFIIQSYPDMVAYGVFNSDGSFNMRALHAYAIKTNQTVADIENTIENALRNALVTDIVDTTVYVSQHELKQAFAQDYLSKKFSILTLPLASYTTAVKKEGVSQQELEEYFAKQNKANKKYWVPQKRSGVYWTFSPQDYGITITDKQIQSYYEQNKHKQFVQTPAQVQIRAIKFAVPDETKRAEVIQKAQKIKEELVQQPTKFEELAKSHSDDKDTASKGGLMPLFARGEKDTALEKAAFRLRNDGDISDIIPTTEGLYIIKRVSKNPIEFKPLDAVKREIETTLRTKQFKDVFQKDIEKKVRTLQENREKFYDFAKEKKAVKKELIDVERTFTPEVEKLFKLKKDGWEFFADGTKGIVITATEIKKSYEPELSAVKDRVEEDLLQEKAHKRLDADIKKAYQEAKDQSLAHVQKTYGGSIEQTDWLKKDDQKQLAELEKRGLAPERMFALTTAGFVSTSSDSSHGFIIKLNQIEPFNEQLFTSKKNELMKRLYTEKKQLNQRSFIASLLRNATIKTVEQEQNTTYNIDDEMQ